MKPTISDIAKAVAKHFKIDVALLKGRSRAMHIARPRQIAIYLSRETTGASYPKIGDYFRKDHSTAIYAHGRIAELLADKEFSETVEACRSLIGSWKEDAKPLIEQITHDHWLATRDHLNGHA